MSFGTAPSVGVYGFMAKAGLDIFRSKGIGPSTRWVDDHLFIWIQKIFLDKYNEQCRQHHLDIAERGQHQNGGRIWFGRQIFDNGTLEEFVEDCQFPIVDLSSRSPHSSEDTLFIFNLDDIDQISKKIRIPWEISKDTNFAYSNMYIGFTWDLEKDLVYLAEPKKKKYLHML